MQNKEIERLKAQTSKQRSNDFDSMMSLEEQIAELNKELEITLNENKSLKKAVKN